MGCLATNKGPPFVSHLQKGFCFKNKSFGGLSYGPTELGILFFMFIFRVSQANPSLLGLCFPHYSQSILKSDAPPETCWIKSTQLRIVESFCSTSVSFWHDFFYIRRSDQTSWSISSFAFCFSDAFSFPESTPFQPSLPIDMFGTHWRLCCVDHLNRSLTAGKTCAATTSKK